MQFEDLKQHLLERPSLVPIFYHEGLRLRPNYLIYTLSGDIAPEQKALLQQHEIPWAEYQGCSALQSVVAYLKSVSGGLYSPSLDAEWLEDASKQCVFLLDPHLIAVFENSLSKKRRGVLIRRPLLASFNFEKALNLGDI